MNLREFIAMGTYGVYVWPCYGLTLAVLLWTAWSARRQLTRQIVAAQRRTQMQKEEQS